MKDFIPQMRPFFGKEEQDALYDYMKEDGFLTEYKKTSEFEKMIAEFTGAKHCIVVNNGTISLSLAALSAGIQAGDEVIIPNYTMIATPNSVQMFGAVPVFVDVEPETLCLDIDLVEKAITPKTKAIMLVSANGRYPKSGIESFEALAGKNKISLIEDAAQGLGSWYPDGRHIGRAGIVGSFSFSAPKIISTGQGGCLITDSDKTATKLRKLKDFGRSSGGNDIHESIGYNFKFTELQACVGIEQMKKLKQRIDRKKEIYNLYVDCLKDLDQIKIFENNNKTTSPWFIDSVVSNRQKLIVHLEKNNIGTRVMYPPINKQKAYSSKGSYPVSEHIGKAGLWLPSMAQLRDNQVRFICECIKEFYEK